MPFYRFECASCGSEFRVLRQNGDVALATCPHCGGGQTKRLLPRIGVIYKGKGYYSTDYRKTKSESALRDSAESTTGTEN